MTEFFALTVDEVSSSVGQFLDSNWSLAHLRRLEHDRTALRSLWQEIAELGWFELAVASDSGGLGVGLEAGAAIAYQLGAHIFAGPILESIAAHHVLRPLGLLSSSTPLVTLAVNEANHRGAPVADAAAIERGRLRGSKIFVPFADEVQNAVVVVNDNGRPALIVTRDCAAGATAAEALDPASRPCNLDLAGLEVVESLTGQPAADAIERLRTAMIVVTASRLLGVATQMLTKSAEYATNREQFGVPIASLQAVRHRLAGMQASVSTAANLCRAATSAVSNGDSVEGSTIVHAAKAYLSRVGRHVAEDAMQVHGGIAFTDEFGLHLYVRHALALQTAWGSERDHELALGRQLVDGRRNN